ncbi:MAG: PhzF family phenazine biosynthesis isomerase [Planctomycetota bacterium]
MKTFIVDSFTDIPFKGNPAGVCLANSQISAGLMQSIASELGFSETAFVVEGTSQAVHSIRYFSPKMEIPLCGHATLAAGKVLFHRNHSLAEILFTTGCGVELQIRNENDGRIAMQFPVYEVQPTEVPIDLLKAVGITEPVNCAFNEETNIILVEIENSAALAALDPDFRAMLESHSGIHGVLVTAISNDDTYDFHSRFFWPWSGGEEDPVTGGTHTFLAKYWSDRLGKTKMHSFQSSARTGSMEVELVHESELLIRAQAKIVFEGDWKAEDPDVQ